MIRYYFRYALRNVIRNQGFAFLNIIGFGLGLAAFLLIMLFVYDELSYDRFNENHHRIFRVDTDLKYGGAESAFAIAASPVAAAMTTSFPEVEYAARMSPAMNIRFRKGDEIIREDRVMYADQSLFAIFSFQVLQGNSGSSLSHPESIVITASTAQKYFGTTDAVGKTLLLQNDTTVHTVTAVIADLPKQSHFHADIFLPLEFLPGAHDTGFNHFNYTTYALLRNRDAAIALTPKLPAFLNSHLSSDMNVAAFEKGGNYIRLALTPLDDIHLHSNKQRELEANSDVNYIYIFSAIAFLILILACINFTNLFTARSANRGREVGVRKVLGSLRTSILLQFLMESFVMTGISVLVALTLATTLLPAFNALAGKQLEVNWNTLLLLIPFIFFITLLVTLMAGMYPAFYLSAFKPVNVLRGNLAAGFKSSYLRGTLVVIQFSIATILVVSTLVMLYQLKFIRSKNVGFNREQVVLIKNAGSMDNPKVLKEEVKRLSGVMNASLSGYLPTGGARWKNNVSTKENALLAEFWSVDTDYIPTLQMNMAAGRHFSDELVTDSAAIIINKAAADQLGIGAAPVGKQVTAGEHTFEVIGVVDDFNFTSLRDNVTPLVMIINQDWQASLIVRIQGEQLSDIVSQIDQLWKKLNPGHAFEYSIMEEDFLATYQTEERMEKMFLIFTVLAIAIAGIGLFGLSAYAAEQRTRELAVRKVLGASVRSLFHLLSMSFIKLVAIAVVVALPFSWIAMERWLSGFAFRAEVPVWIFFSAAALILMVGSVTITIQTLKASLRNPADSLRTD